MAEKCICCGAVIPEGRQVCPTCEEWMTLYRQGEVCLVTEKERKEVSEELLRLRTKDDPQKPVERLIAFCPVCDNELYNKQPYCDNCGKKIDWQ